MYRNIPVLVCTCMYQYVLSLKVHTGTYKYKSRQVVMSRLVWRHPKTSQDIQRHSTSRDILVNTSTYKYIQVYRIPDGVPTYNVVSVYGTMLYVRTYNVSTYDIVRQTYDVVA